MDRRAFLTASTVAATATALGTAAAAETEGQCGSTGVPLAEDAAPAVEQVFPCFGTVHERYLA